MEQEREEIAPWWSIRYHTKNRAVEDSKETRDPREEKEEYLELSI